MSFVDLFSSAKQEVSRSTQRRVGFIAARQPRFFFWLALVYLAILIVLLIGRARGWLLLDKLPSTLYGFIPLGVPWFGALGGVTIMLYGVFEHVHEWDSKWNYWHLARPFAGSIMGTLGYLIFVGVITATGTHPTLSENPNNSASQGAAEASPTSATNPPKQPTLSENPNDSASQGATEASPTPATNPPKGTGDPMDFIPYYVLAFLLGFRETAFRELIKRAADMLFGPGGAIAPSPNLTIAPVPFEFGDVPVGMSSEKTLTLINDGGSDLVINKKEGARSGLTITDGDANAFVLVDDLSSAVIRPGASTTLTGRFAPPTPGEHRAALLVRSNAGIREIELLGTGIAR